MSLMSHRRPEVEPRGRPAEKKTAFEMLGSILSQYLPALLALLAVVLALLLHPMEEMMMNCPAPSTMLQTPPDVGSQLKVETLNTWGLWLVSKKRRQRMLCLAQHLKQSDAVGAAGWSLAGAKG